MSGQVDGVSLAQFQVGRIYNFRPEHAAFVLAIGAGEVVDSDGEPAHSLMQGVLPAIRGPAHAYTGPERRTHPRE